MVESVNAKVSSIFCVTVKGFTRGCNPLLGCGDDPEVECCQPLVCHRHPSAKRPSWYEGRGLSVFSILDLILTLFLNCQTCMAWLSSWASTRSSSLAGTTGWCGSHSCMDKRGLCSLSSPSSCGGTPRLMLLTRYTTQLPLFSQSSLVSVCFSVSLTVFSSSHPPSPPPPPSHFFPTSISPP